MRRGTSNQINYVIYDFGSRLHPWLNVETKRAVTSIFMPFKTLIFRLSKKHKIQITFKYLFVSVGSLYKMSFPSGEVQGYLEPPDGKEGEDAQSFGRNDETVLPLNLSSLRYDKRFPKL